MDHGVVTDWDDMEKIWSHLYTKELRIESEEHPLLLTEAPLNPRKNREKAAQIFFETFNVPALYVSIQAVLALYATGRTTGLVLDSGDGVTHTVPVYQGFSIPTAIQRTDIAGRDITEYLQILLRKSAGINLTSSAEREIVRNIKERHCYLSLDPRKEEEQESYRITGTTSGDRPPEVYRLPDNKEIRLGSERFRAPEILFQPLEIGSEAKGVHQLLWDSISRVDLDLRPALYESIILSGGSTLTRGFGERLLSEIKSLAKEKTTIKIFAPPERKYSTWIGGSILGGLSTFKKMWVSSDEYRENPDIIHIKCM